MTALALADFWDMEQAERERRLVDGILAAHARHYQTNLAYRRAVSARGVGPEARPEDLPRLLRLTSQTFKSYIEVLGTPFPQDNPQGFLDWLATQLSLKLPQDRLKTLAKRYRSLEAMLTAIERACSDLGLEILTSSGTSGRASIIVRDRRSTDLTVESFYLAFQRYLGMKAEHRAIFMMPRRTRIAMARMAQFSVRRVGLPPERVHFAIPFPAQPDQVRIRSGRTFRSGLRGWLERRAWHPAMNFIQSQVVDPYAVRFALRLLRRASTCGEKVLLFGSLAQVHAVAQALLERGESITLAPGSLLGTGGGAKDLGGLDLEKIREDLRRTFRLANGAEIPVRDVYGMAEANWAAMQCARGSYHIPPWVLATTVDDDGALQTGPVATGLLAFFDPYGGGDLFPAFFRTADRVTLVRGYGKATCECGDAGAYITCGSIQRVDLLEEAGCAAQL